MKGAKDLIPWQVTDISIRPYDDYWSFNPSIHFDGTTWRCVLRCCDYAMPNGVTVRSKTAGPTGQRTKNAMVIFDPVSWQPVAVFKMHEKDGYPRASTPHLGYEDMRIFWTDKGGLQGIAASLHLKRDRTSADGSPQHQPPEQVLLSFDDAYDVVAARPIRGSWSGTPQKNWSPFDGCEEPRFIYSIGRGTLFDDAVTLHGDAAIVRPSAGSHRLAAVDPPSESPAADTPVLAPTPQAEAVAPPVEQPKSKPPKPPDRKVPVRGGNVQIMRGRRLALDASASRPSSMPQAVVARTSDVHAAGNAMTRSGTVRLSDASTRSVGGRVRLPGYDGLRGGTQLIRVGEGAWLGIGHEMKFVNGKKSYWHIWYVVDDRGKMRASSEPMKLAPNGIEFAAGMGIDGDRVVVSFGVDDMECKLGETRLSAVMKILQPVSR